MALRVCREDEKDEKLEEQRLHLENAEAGYISKRRDKEAAINSWRGKTCTLGQNTSKDAVDMITYDFQKNSETPNLFHNNVYYLRQLSTYSYGIHDCAETQGYLYLWDETTGKKGSSEVASCLHKFFRLQIRGKVSSLLVTIKCFKSYFFEEKEHISSLRTQQPLTTLAA